MTRDDDVAAFVADQLAPLGRIALRRMFGKAGVFCDGAMLGVLSDGALYLRVDDANRAAFAEAAAGPPLRYVRQGVVIDLAYWRAPDRLLDDPEELLAWARLALAAARRVAARRGGAAPRRRARGRA